MAPPSLESRVSGVLLAVFILVSQLQVYNSLSSSGAHVCSHKTTHPVYSAQHYTAACGLWGWARCPHSRRLSSTAYKTSYKCCTGWAVSSHTDCAKPVCYGNPYGWCPNGGKCKTPDVCECLPGFSPPECNDINECSTDNGGCEQICINTRGFFRCECKRGYRLKEDGKSCQVICHGESNGKCQNGGTCVEPDVCSCPDGYAPPACADADECLQSPAVCDHRCTNTFGSYRCSCEPGFYLSDDFRTCSNASLSICFSGNDVQACPVCSYHSETECSCPPGLFVSSDGRRCSPPCMYNLCQNGGNCVEIFSPESHETTTSPTFGAGTTAVLTTSEGTTTAAVPLGHANVSLSTDNASTSGIWADTTSMGSVNGTNTTFHFSTETSTPTFRKKAVIGFECICYGTGFGGKFCETNTNETTSTLAWQTVDTDNHAGELTTKSLELESTLGNATTLPSTTSVTETLTIISLPDETTSTVPPTTTTRVVDNSPEDLLLLEDTYWNRTNQEDEISQLVANCTLNQTMSTTSTDPPSVRAPGSVLARSGKAFHKIKLTVSSSQRSFIQICAGEGAEVRPSVIEVRPPEQETSFEISSEERGLILVAITHPGAGEALTTIGVQFEDVYKRLNLKDAVLPRGSYNLDITVKKTAFRLASTSPWCTLQTNKKIHLTDGTVFSVAGEDSLPVSSIGLEVSVGKELRIGPISSFRNFDKCMAESTKDSRTKRDWMQQILRHLSDDDKEELVEKQAVLGTLFRTLRSKLPPWIRFSLSKDKVEGKDEATVQIMSGFKAQRLPECFGAPLMEKTMYHVYKFSQSFVLDLFSESVMPRLDKNEEYCFVVDLNQDNGGTVVIKFPRPLKTTSPLSLFRDSYKYLTALDFSTSAFGLSFPGKLNGHRRPLGELGSIKDESYYDAKAFTANPSESITLWNGDTLFSYPAKRDINAWITADTSWTVGKSGEVQFSVKTDLEGMVVLPDLHQSFEHFSKYPWEINLRSVSGFSFIIKLWIAGKPFSIDLNNIGPTLFAIDVFGYVSLGGQDYKRIYCGSSANPPGIFLEANINGKLLRGIPYLQDKVANLTFSSLDVKVQFFKIYDEDAVWSVDYEKFESLFTRLKRYVTSVHTFVKRSKRKLKPKENELIGEDVSEIQGLLSAANDNLEEMILQIKSKRLTGLTDQVLRNITYTADKAWVIQERVDTSYMRGLKSLVTKLRKKLVRLDRSTKDVYRGLFDQSKQFAKAPGSWGIRARFSIVIAGDLYALQGYFIQAEKVVSRCGIFSKYFDHMKGEKAIRVFGKVEFPVQVVPKVKVDFGFGVEIAISQSKSSLFVVRIHAQAKFLGFKLTLDVFINNNGLHAIFEANIYDIFRARITMSANVFVPYIKRYALLRVELMPGGDGFEGSLIDVLKNYVKKMAEDAYKRLQGAQNSLDAAKVTVTKAQNVMRKAKKVLDNAQGEMDKAVNVLEKAKDKLEAAKAPFRRAIGALNKAQSRVDGLCTIRKCQDICIPGIIPKICWAGWFPYPCFKTTSCMIRIPNPVCVLKNAACFVVRGLAYTALAIAKAAVHIPMLALDVAKVALTVAQVAVKIARVALDVAKVAIDVAIVTLDAAKVVMNIAKAALEAVKLLVKLGYQVFEFIVDYGLKSLFDIKTCGFEVVVSTKEGVEFEVFCNINPFRLGWRNVGFRINFSNILSSLWNAAKSLAAQFVGLIKNAFGRRKREVTRDILTVLGRIVRHRRATNQSESSTSGGPSFGEFFRNGTLVTNVSWEHDTQFWEERCSEYEPAYEFLKVAIETLYNASIVVTKQAEEARAVSKVDVWESHDDSGLPLKDGEINFNAALSDFNITREELLKAVKEANVSDNVITRESKHATDFVVKQNNNTADTISKYDVITLWKSELHNISTKTFSDNQCASFYDCVVWSVIQLSEVFDSVEKTLIPQAHETLSELEFVMYDLLDSANRSVSDVQNSSSGALELLARMDFRDVFCGTAPSVLQHPMNGTVLRGRNFSMSCQGVGVPSPNYYWYKNDELYMYGTDTLVFTNVSLSDEANYTCVVGNHIQNVSTQDASLLVVYPPRIVSHMTPYVEFVTGDNIKIACKTDGKPRAVTHWNTTYGIIHNTTHDLLYLESNSSLPSGLYSCKSFNEYGWDASQEILVDIKATYPACPSAVVEVGFISASGGQQTPFASDGHKFEDLFASAVSLIVLNDRVNISVEVLGINYSFGEVTLAVDMDCANNSECIRQMCKDDYYNMTRHLQDSLKALQKVVTEEKFLFSIGGVKYYFNRAMLDIGQIMPRCPQNYTRKLEITCVLTEQSYHIPGPTSLQLAENDQNITLLWAAPDDLKSFIRGTYISINCESNNLWPFIEVDAEFYRPEEVILTDAEGRGYTLVVILHGGLEITRELNITSSVTSWALNRQAYFGLPDTTYSIRLRAFTESHRSLWMEQTLALTSAQAATTTFGVLMGLLFASLTVISIMAAIYHLKAPKTKVTALSSTPTTPCTTSEAFSHTSDLKVPVPRSAWN